MARSTPAQKPRGWANKISGSCLSISSTLQNPDDFYFKFQRLSGQRMIEIKQRALLVNLAQHAGKASAARCCKIDEVTDAIIFIHGRILFQRGARDALNQFRVARPKSLIGRQLKRLMRPLFQSQQASLQKRRQLALAKLQSGRLFLKSADDIFAGHGCQAVVQCEVSVFGDDRDRCVGHEEVSVSVTARYCKPPCPTP